MNLIVITSIRSFSNGLKTSARSRRDPGKLHNFFEQLRRYHAECIVMIELLGTLNGGAAVSQQKKSVLGFGWMQCDGGIYIRCRFGGGVSCLLCLRSSAAHLTFAGHV